MAARGSPYGLTVKTTTTSVHGSVTTGWIRLRTLQPSLAALAVAFTIFFATAAAPGASGANFALLVNGDPTFSHAHNIEIAVGALTALGYPRANILVVGDTGEVRAAIRDLERRLSADDLLLLYTTGHGERKKNESRLYLRNGDFGANELSRLIFGLKFRRLIYVGDQCYSGGFATAFASSTRNVVAVTATDDTHMARCEPFVRPLWRAAVEQRLSIEAAYQIASQSAKAALDGAPESSTRYLATGAAAGHENGFAG